MTALCENLAIYHTTSPKELGLSVEEMFITVPKHIIEVRKLLKENIILMVELIEEMARHGAGVDNLLRYRRIVEVAVGLL